MQRALTRARFALSNVTLAIVLSASIANAAPIELKVMTRNLYFGADLTPVFTAPLDQIPFTVGGLVADVAATKPEERMRRVAQEIFDLKPHVVGLQEASLWRAQTPSDFVLGSAPNASVPIFGGHYRQQIVDALANLGASYKMYAFKQNPDNELPGFDPTSPNLLTDYRLTDHDVILVRDDLPISKLKVIGEGTQTFAVNVSIPFAGSMLEIAGSYGYVDVAIEGKAVRIFNTHLEPLSLAVNESQALELIGAADASPYPHVLLGDFNTTTISGPTDTHQFLLDAGFSDAWADKGAGPGFTWGFDGALSDPLAVLSERLDYVFHRGGLTTGDVEVVGTSPFDLGVDGPPLWASDHAGVFATLQFVPVPSTILLLVLGWGVLVLPSSRRFRPEPELSAH